MPTFSRTSVLAGGTAALLAAGGLGAAAAAADPEDPGMTAADLHRLADAAIGAAGGGRVTATELDDGAHEVEVVLDDGTEVEVRLDRDLTVLGTEREAPEPPPADPIGTPDLAGAAEAAVAAAGGGRVTDTDVDDDEGTYEVEVTLDDGTEVDVQLDRDLAVTGTWRDGPDTQVSQPIADPDLAGAAAAAVRAAGGGQVTGTDVEDEGTYEVEVTLGDGTEVDVQLDRDLAVIGTWRDAPDGDD